MNPANPEETGTLEISFHVGLPQDGGRIKSKKVIILRLRNITLAEATDYAQRYKRINSELPAEVVWTANPLYLR